MKKNLIKLLFALILCASKICNSYAEEKLLITVNQFVKHPALDDSYNGLHKALHDRGILPDKAKITSANAQGSMINSIQIAKHQASLKPAFMVAISTPSAQSALKTIDKNLSTLAFVAVSDPKAANIVRDGVIGVSDNPPIKDLLTIIRKILPNAKNIGVIYNAGEINSVKIIEKLELAAKKSAFRIKKISINNSSDIKMAMNKLVDSDIIYLPQDNTVISAVDHIISLSKSLKKPLIANDPSLVEKGVFLALGTNYFSNGEKLGHLIVDIIEDKSTPLAIINSNNKELKINKLVAEELKIIIPEHIKEQ